MTPEEELSEYILGLGQRVSEGTLFLFEATEQATAEIKAFKDSEIAKFKQSLVE